MQENDQSRGCVHTCMQAASGNMQIMYLHGPPSWVLHNGSGPVHCMDACNQGGDDLAGCGKQPGIIPAAHKRQPSRQAGSQVGRQVSNQKGLQALGMPPADALPASTTWC
jgi:hypothetical protein